MAFNYTLCQQIDSFLKQLHAHVLQTWKRTKDKIKTETYQEVSTCRAPETIWGILCLPNSCSSGCNGRILKISKDIFSPSVGTRETSNGCLKENSVSGHFWINSYKKHIQVVKYLNTFIVRFFLIYIFV